MEALAHALLGCVTTTLGLFWDSLYGLIFGFLISAIAQTVFSRGALERALGPNLRGIASGALFGIVASACSYGAAAAARGFYRKGADLRAVLAFLISSTNMNVAILIMFWAMLGWRFAFAEFVGGIVIIAVVAGGLSLTLRRDALAAAPEAAEAAALVSECLQCGMEGEAAHAVEHDGVTYRFCGPRHEAAFRADPDGVLAQHASERTAVPGLASLRERATWRGVLGILLADVDMLRGELVLGFVVAGCAAALIPPQWIATAVGAVGAVPLGGYPLVLLAGLALAVLTFVCSMGNVPIARVLAMAGVPLGANTTFIYGDLLIPPMIGIYRKSFPPRLVWTFLGLFTLGAMLAGALMDGLFGRWSAGAPAMGMSVLSDRFTIVANALALVALAAVLLAGRPVRGAHVASAAPGHAAP
jgi:uncharacterized membrane protein YraQ (UPF0718 family)